METMFYRNLCFVIIILCSTGITIVATADDECPQALNMKVSVVMTRRADEQLTKTFNIENDKGYVDVTRYNEEADRQVCVMRIPVSILYFDTRAENGIYNDSVARELRSSFMVIGEDIKAVRRFVQSTKAPYIISEPLGVHAEEEMDLFTGLTGTSSMYSLWPSPTTLIAATAANVRLYTIGSMLIDPEVLMLTYTETEDSIRYVDRLFNAIINQSGCRVTVYDLHKIKKKLNEINRMTGLQRLEYIKVICTRVRQLIKRPRMKTVVVYMGTTIETQLDLLRVLFNPGADLEREDVVWLFASTDLVIQPAVQESLLLLPIVKSYVFVMEPCLLLDKNDVQSLDDFMNRALSNDGFLGHGLLVSKLLIQSLNAPFSVDQALKYFQTNCPGTDVTRKGLNSTTSMIRNTGCPEHDSLIRAGYPKVSFIRTKVLKTPTVGFCSDQANIIKDKHKFYNCLRNMLILASVFFSNNLSHYMDTYFGTTTDTSKNLLQFNISDHTIVGISPKAPQRYAVLIQDKPFVMKNDDGTYTGLAIDIYNAVLQELTTRGIVLKLEFRETDAYGSKQGQTWSGVFGELSKEENVIGIGQISITRERSEDGRFTFSPSFALTSLTYMTKKMSQYDAYTSFLRPFTQNVWLAILVAMCFSALYLRITDVWNPFKENVPDDSRFNWRESLWHSYLVVTQAGAPFGASMIPARVYSVFYWFFALIVVGCYTGNLVGFLSESALVTPSINDLIRYQNFGMVSNTSISSVYLERLFNQPIETYNNSRMQNVKTYEEGFQKVKGGQYVFVGTSLVMSAYQRADEDCLLHVYEPQFNERHVEPIAFPMNKDWENADEFYAAMAILKERGQLGLLYRKWFKQSSTCSTNEDNDTVRLGFINFHGLIVLTSIGIMFSFIVLAIKLIHLKLKSMANKRDTTGGGVDQEEEEEAMELQSADA